MTISKKTRILLLIAVDTAFFFLEIIIGYTAHSLALVADAFHMLNDIISLCVGYWATDVAENRSSSSDYTYGWARAEILGGLINGVFLIALCVTIILDAIQRFFEVQEVSNPKLVLIVGSIGLVFNILGLFLFHEHGHDHGDGGHSHSHGDELGEAETGHAGHKHDAHDHSHAHAHGTEHGNGQLTHSHGAAKHDHSVRWQDPDSSQAAEETTPLMTSISNRQKRNHRRSGSRTYDSIDKLPIHPASLRNDMRAQARMEHSDDSSTEDDPEDEEEALIADNETGDHTAKNTGIPRRRSSRRKSSHANGGAVSHQGHKHAQPKTASSKGGHHHDENMRGMFLHVLGDALGNVGVMASALIIWLSHWQYRFYFDPLISLFITVIILKSAIPLVRDTAKPLLQATPEDINVEHIQEDIESLPGIRSCHHIHVWALTRSKLIATLDVQLDFDFESPNGTQRWMDLAMEIKSCLHGFNIHNSTIQPEFCLDYVKARKTGRAHGAHKGGDADGANEMGIDGAADVAGGLSGGASREEHDQHHGHDHDHPHDHDHDHDHDHNDHDHHDHTDHATPKTTAGKCGCGDGECLLEDSCEGMACCGPPAGNGHGHAHSHGSGSGTATPK